MEPKTFKFEVKIKGCDQVFGEGLNPGVIGLDEVTFTPKNQRSVGDDNYALALAIEEKTLEILEELITVVVTEVK